MEYKVGYRVQNVVNCPQLPFVRLDGEIGARFDRFCHERISGQFAMNEILRFTDYHELIACSEVDAVDICTPNVSHCEIGMEAVRMGKPFNMEKPLGVSAEEAEELLRFAEEKNVPSQICFSYRFSRRFGMRGSSLRTA